jgi:hypothetical protein
MRCRAGRALQHSGRTRDPQPRRRRSEHPAALLHRPGPRQLPQRNFCPAVPDGHAALAKLGADVAGDALGPPRPFETS